MKIKEGFVLMKLGDGFVAVATGAACREFNGVLRLNQTGGFLWQRILDGDDTREKLLASMRANYPDLEEATAGADLDAFLGEVSLALEA